jgi:hypothetical protein
MAYQSLNGASATALSALHKYGLLERVGDEVKVSERALRILHPHSPDERSRAIREAANDPPLFTKLAERFPGQMPNEELLRNYLMRDGFATGAVPAVILAYRETSELVERETGGHDSEAIQPSEVHMQPASATRFDPTPTRKPSYIQTDERELCPYNFEGGGFVKLVVGGNIDTETALDMIETQIKLKRNELKAKQKVATPPSADREVDENPDA